LALLIFFCFLSDTSFFLLGGRRCFQRIAVTWGLSFCHKRIFFSLIASFFLFFSLVLERLFADYLQKTLASCIGGDRSRRFFRIGAIPP